MAAAHCSTDSGLAARLPVTGSPPDVPTSGGEAAAPASAPAPGLRTPGRPRQKGGLLCHADPTPAEIAAECAAIRDGWSELERLQRAGAILTKADIQYFTKRRVVPPLWRPPVARGKEVA